MKAHSFWETCTKSLDQGCFSRRSNSEVFSKGLVDAASKETFDLQLQQLCESWETLVPGFPKWFVATQASTFCMYMIVPLHEKAQLGSHTYTHATNPAGQTALDRSPVRVKPQQIKSVHTA